MLGKLFLLDFRRGFALLRQFFEMSLTTSAVSWYLLLFCSQCSSMLLHLPHCAMKVPYSFSFLNLDILSSSLLADIQLPIAESITNPFSRVVPSEELVCPLPICMVAQAQPRVRLTLIPSFHHPFLLKEAHHPEAPSAHHTRELRVPLWLFLSGCRDCMLMPEVRSSHWMLLPSCTQCCTRPLFATEVSRWRSARWAAWSLP